MRSSFFGIGVATQGLYTAKTALDIANHNITNAETPGYSRQFALQKASRPLPNMAQGMVGTGTEIVDIKRYRDEYLDYKYWNVTNKMQEYSVKTEFMSQMELILNEPSDTGYSTFFNDIFESLHTLSKNPGDPTSRNYLVDTLSSFGKYMNDVDAQLSRLQQEANFGIKTQVDRVNFLSSQLASLNTQIGNLELTGNTANDLRDERTRLVDELSGIMNVTAKEITDVNGQKTFRISINGQVLVENRAVNFLTVQPRATLNNPEDYVDMYDIAWTSGKTFYIDNDNLAGSLRGYIDLRDGNNAENFKGTVTAGAGTNTITVSNPSRNDIPPMGTLDLDNTKIVYNSYTYDEATNEITFNLAAPSPATVTGTYMGYENTFKGIPYYRQQLNEFVRTIAQQFNALHETGQGGTGTQLLAYKGYDGSTPLVSTSKVTYNAITAGNFATNQAIVNDRNLIMTTTDALGSESANDLILSLIELRHDPKMFAKGEADNYMQSLIGELGIDAKQIESFRKGQVNMVNLVNNQRLSISGVDINEETTSLVKFQQAYNVAAKIISVFDEIYNVTINQMGAR